MAFSQYQDNINRSRVIYLELAYQHSYHTTCKYFHDRKYLAIGSYLDVLHYLYKLHFKK